MKSKEVLMPVFARVAAILAFAALCVLAILLSTGTLKIDLSVFEDGTYTASTTADSPDTLSPEGSDTQQNPIESSEISPESSENPGIDTEPANTDPVETVSITYPTVEELKAKGYKGTYASWVEGMELALVFEDGVLPVVESYGNTRKDETLTCITYQEDGVEFPSYVVRTTERKAVEVYMGYIMIDTGKGSCTDILPVYTETKNAEGETVTVRSERKSYSGVNTLTIFDSDGNFIGTYAADMVVPAYTRDTSDRALFKYDGNYYYIDSATGDFLPSDYIDETDNRGLYFDYNPSYGKSDNLLNKYYTEQEVTFTYILDTSVYYTANQVDWKIAKQLILADGSYAAKVAKRNAPFNMYYIPALKEVQAEEASRAAETTTAPETETQAVSETPAETTLAESSSPEAETTVPAQVTETTPADISVPETSPLSPDDSTTPASDDSTPASGDGSGEDSTSAPETTPEETTKDPHITVDRVYNAYRFTYGKTQPEVDTEKTITQNYTGYSSLKQNIEGIITWKSQYSYAKAFNFSGGRAVTVDDTGVLHIINTNLYQVICLNKHYYDSTYFTGYQTHIYYTEPFWKDVTQLGHYYYDHGLLRVRKITAPYHMIVTYSSEDLLIDTSGNVYTLPEGYSLFAYSEGFIVVEREGSYGVYHKDGYWVAQPVYSSAQPFVEGLCVLGKTDASGNTVYGMINSSGDTVLPFIYKSITNASTGVVVAWSEETGWQVFSKMTK